jgi:hypothetical protein
MAGIGKYTKGKKFQLKSGNTPSFKTIGSSPANMNSFGVGTGTSPYKQEGSEKSEEELANQVNAKTAADNITDNASEEPKVNKVKTIASKVGNTLVGAFTSGLDAVYGSGKVIPGNKVKFHDPKKKKEEKKFGTTALDNDKE